MADRLKRKMHEIDNTELTISDIPEPNADWEDIEEFALTFDGYKACGSFEKCSEVAMKKEHGSLTELRVCLFYQQRHFRFMGLPPEEEDMPYFHSLIEQIREYVVAGKI